MDLGVTEQKPASLTRSQAKYSSIEKDNRAFIVLKDVPHFLQSWLLNLRCEVKPVSEPHEFVDRDATLLQPGLGFNLAFLNCCAVRSQHHSQAGQGTRVRFFLAIERKLDTHSIAVSLLGPPRFAARAR